MNLSLNHRGVRRALGLALVTGAAVCSAQAQYFSATDNFPTPNVFYSLDPGEQMAYTNGYSVTSLSFGNFSTSIAPPSSGSASTGVFTFTFNLTLLNTADNSFQQYSGTGNGNLLLSFLSQSSDTRSYGIQLTQFDMGLSNGFQIRQSLTAQSTGNHDIQSVSGGYWITSNLILNTDLNAGGTWYNQTGSGAHDVAGVSETPEPFTMALGFAGIGLFVRRRRARA